MRHQNRRAVLTLFIVCVAAASDVSAATLRSKTLQGWELYVQLTEKRINTELADGKAFLSMDFKPQKDRERIRKLLTDGGVYVEKMGTKDARGKGIDVEDGMIHHWYGSIFVPNVTLGALRHWLQDYDHQAEYFPEVEKSKLLARNGEDFRISLRLVRKKVVTVHYNTEHSVSYRDISPTRVASRSVATRIAELADAGSLAEKEKAAADDSGFLWRLNSYWRFEETEGGVIVECESISLSRPIPFGLGWLVGPFVESVPRESLNGMLTSIREGVRREPGRIRLVAN